MHEMPVEHMKCQGFGKAKGAKLHTLMRDLEFHRHSNCARVFAGNKSCVPQVSICFEC